MMAASVKTRVVSWKEAAEMNESVDKDALVIPNIGTLKLITFKFTRITHYQIAGVREVAEVKLEVGIVNVRVLVDMAYALGVK